MALSNKKKYYNLKAIITLDEYFIDIKKRTKTTIINENVFNNLEYLIAELKAKPEFIKQVANKLSLRLNNEMEMNENSSPVCYANSPEVREEFRPELDAASISLLDILYYIYSTLNEEGKMDVSFVKLSNFIFPENKAEFFNSAKNGKELITKDLVG